MNIKEIKALSDIMLKTGLTVMEIEEDGLRVRMEKNSVAAVPPTSVEIAANGPVAAAAAVLPAAQPQENGGKCVKSPMVGVFYAAPSPDAEPLVSVGSKVKKGDVLCIVEAMKLMNEITADCDGEITEICVENGAVVEYGQPLFRLQ